MAESHHHPHRLDCARAEAGSRFQDDRARISRAQQAAEALFAPKQQVSEPSAPESVPPANRVARKPRILRALPTPRARDEPLEGPVAPEQPAPPTVPASHVTRIRVWLKYGMTVSQVAHVYGVPASDIERIRQKPDG